MQIEKRKVNELEFYPGNPRKISKDMLEALKRDIEEFGIVEPLVINKNNQVIGGNQRLKALQELGVEEVDVVVVDLPISKEKALNVALNKIQGEWDLDLLIPFIEDIDSEDLDLTGFGDDELKILLEGFEPIPPIDEDNEKAFNEIQNDKEKQVIFVYPKNEEEYEDVISYLKDNNIAYHTKEDN